MVPHEKREMVIFYLAAYKVDTIRTPADFSRRKALHIATNVSNDHCVTPFKPMQGGATARKIYGSDFGKKKYVEQMTLDNYIQA